MESSIQELAMNIDNLMVAIQNSAIQHDLTPEQAEKTLFYLGVARLTITNGATPEGSYPDALATYRGVLRVLGV